MQLYFVRHGQSENNLLWEIHGHELGRSDDPDLTERGQLQAQAVANLIASGHPQYPCLGNPGGFGITHVYSSLMVRAAATGHAIAEQLDLPLTAWPEVHETGGIYHDIDDQQVGQQGKTRSYLQERFPRLVLPGWVDENGWWNRPFEERPERIVRARKVVEQLYEWHGGTDDRVVMVSHGGFYNYLLAALMDLPARNPVWYLLNNTAISRIDFDRDEVLVVYQNRIDHLGPDLLE